MLTKAMIMAAGVGSRLEPLSSIVPKPLVPLANMPTMDILIKHLVSSGINNVIANTFYKAEEIQNHYKNNNFGINIQFVKEQALSGTAGGVKKCQFFFNENEDFIVLSGDGLTDININEAYLAHKNSNSIITIVTKEIEKKEVSKYGIIVTDKHGYVDSFQEKPKIEEAKSNLANTGIYIFNYKIFDFIPENTFYDFAKNVFPSVMKNNIPINTYVHSGYWSDIGSLEQYKKSNADIINRRVSSVPVDVVNSVSGKRVCGTNFQCADTSSLIGDNVIGNNCTIGKNSKIINSILWDNVEVQDNITVENSILLPNTVVNSSVFNGIITKQKEKEKIKIFI